MTGRNYASLPSGAKRHLPTWWRGQARIPSRWIGWLVAGSLLVAFGALAWGATRVPVVQAAGNPLYLHGTGAVPCAAPTTMDQAVGVRTPAANLRTIQSTAGAATARRSCSDVP